MSDTSDSETDFDDSVESDSSDSNDDYHLFAYVELSLIKKIQEGKFVELPKLLPTGNLDFEDDDDATITKQGRLFLNRTKPPAQEKELPFINSFSK